MALGIGDFLEEGFSRDSFGAEYNGIFNSDGSYRSGFINNPNGDLYAGEFLTNSYHGKGILEKLDGTFCMWEILRMINTLAVGCY